MSASNLPPLIEPGLVAIVGRPNVGKSTLFNRFIGFRKAITDPTPGVTRDPVEALWSVGDREFRLVDTGGVKLEYQGFDELVGSKSREVIKKADCILLVLDVTEVTAEDQEMISYLRSYAEKVFLVVNKVDSEKREYAMGEFYAHGYKRVYAVSAAHGLGCPDLAEAIADFLPQTSKTPKKEEDDSRIKLAVLGKPNTGKSTLLNTLTNSDLSIVSDVPGTTRDVIEGSFCFKDTLYSILDTAGIRKKGKVTDNVEYYSVNRAIATIDQADVVLLMIDSLEGLSDQDKKIAGLIVKKGKGVVLVLNKWDRMSAAGNTLDAVRDRISFLFPVLDFAPVVPLSALYGQGIDELLRTVYKVWKELHKRIETSTLNKHLEKWTNKNPPPRWNKGHYKIRYITQVSVKPVEFAIFVNRTKGFPEFYVRYLINNIRKELGFSSVPLVVHVRG